MHRAARTSSSASLRPVLGLAALALLGACGHPSMVETGLNKDLALADQLQRRSAPPLVSRQELTSPAPAAPTPIIQTRVVMRTVNRSQAVRIPTPRETSPVATTSRTPAPTRGGDEIRPGVARSVGGEVVANGPTAPADRDPAIYDAGTSNAGAYGAGSYGSGDVGSGTGASSAPVYGQPQAHTARDGVFGSVAGAMIGAAASHGDRVRGGLIGAVAGGALGAIYGHSVDRTYAGVQTSPGYRTYSSYRSTPKYRGTI